MGKIYKDNVTQPEVQQNQDANINIGIGTFVMPVDNIKHRDDVITHAYDILNRAEYRAVLLVGDPGMGKRAVVEGLAKKFKDNSNTDQIINFDFDMMITVVNQGQDFNATIDRVFKGVEETNGILNINNMGSLLHINCYANGGFSFLNHMKDEIDNNGLRVIATSSTKEFKDMEDGLHLLLSKFTVIKLNELTMEQTKDIIEDEVSAYEDYHRVKLPKNISDLICTNADKYIKDKPFPLKAEHLIDDVCAHIAGNNNFNIDINNLMDENDKLKLELFDALEASDYTKCEDINARIDANDKTITKLGLSRKKVKATEMDVLEAIGAIVGVNMAKLNDDKTQFLREMPDALKKVVIGQDETIDKLVKNIRRTQLGLRKQAHSAGNYMFIGSTGVGKTWLAKQLAKYLYGSTENLLRFDMSEYQAEIDVSKLLGSAPGYVGYKESGLLVKGLAKKPESVLLFDEIEKAHPKIYDVLLQLLDEGKITGSDGKTVDGSKALIIFTSNIGVKSAKELSTPMGFTNNATEEQMKKEESIMFKSLRKRFSPEFLNRLDSICYFNPLGRDVLKSILDNELKEMNENIRQITGKEVVLTEAVTEWLIKKVEEEKNGARPVIRLLQQEIEEIIANYIVDDNELLKSKKKTITADLQDDKIVLC